MKKRQLWFFSTLLFLSCGLHAQEFVEEIPEEASSGPYYPFSITTDFVYVDPADFRTPGLEGEKLRYKQVDAAVVYTHPHNAYSGWIFGAGYVGTEVDWKENPDFTEKFFNYVSLSTGAYTKGFPDWFWSAVFNMFIDTEVLDIADYALYQGVLWGKYSWCEWLTLNAGFILEIGLSKEKVWPIVGFTLNPYPEVWQLSVIYPVDISFDYFLSKCWTIGGALRFLRNRHRVNDKEPLPRGIFEYRTTGAELDLTFQPFRWISLTGFTGSTFDGDLKITDSNNHNATHYKFKGSFYLGASAILSF